MSRPGLRLAASEWNLYEIANGADVGQRERRVAFLEKLRPVWMVERVDIQRQEVQRFFFKAHYGVDVPDLVVFAPNLSVVDSGCREWARYFYGDHASSLVACKFAHTKCFMLLRGL